MRVFFFSVFFEYLGSETYYTSEIKSVIEHYPNTKYIVYSLNCERNRVLRYNENILWVQRKTLKNLNTILLFLKDIIIIFTKYKPHIIHSVYVIESIITGFIGKIFRVPSIFHSRGMDFNYFPFINLKKNVLARIAGRLNNIIITVSKAMKKDGIKLNIKPRKMILIYDGIELSRFIPNNDNKESRNKKFEILHIGRFSSEKNHEIIIKTCRKLKDNGIDFYLTFIGIGPLYEKMKNLVMNYNLKENISFLGWINHRKIYNYMKNADLFILPSKSEGMPISVLEAMSMKLPVVLTDVGGMPELIQEKGGILIKKNDINQLYNAILQFVNNLHDVKLGGEINRKFIINNFNWNVHADKLYRIYEKLRKK